MEKACRIASFIARWAAGFRMMACIIALQALTGSSPIMPRIMPPPFIIPPLDADAVGAGAGVLIV